MCVHASQEDAKRGDQAPTVKATFTSTLEELRSGFQTMTGFQTVTQADFGDLSIGTLWLACQYEAAQYVFFVSFGSD